MTTLLAASVLNASAASPSSLPTLVLVPAAFTSPAIFNPLLPHLGPYPVLPTKPLPSISLSGSQPLDAKSDANFVREELLALLDEGRQVVVVAHSHGALGAMAAARDLSSINRRREGKPGGVAGIVLLAGTILAEGETYEYTDAGPRDIPPWYYEDPETHIARRPPFEVWARDVPKSQHELLDAALCESSTLGFTSPAQPTAWTQDEFRGRLAYVRLLGSILTTEETQDRMLRASEAHGIKWFTRDCEVGGHLPWLKDPGAVASLIKKSMQDFDRGQTNGRGY